MIYLSVGVILWLFYYYKVQESREKQLIDAYIPSFGPFIDSFNLDGLTVDAEDKLSWGAKLYVYNDGLIIGGPDNVATNYHLSFDEVQGFTTQGRMVSIYCVQRHNQPQKIELSTSPLEQRIDYILSTNI